MDFKVRLTQLVPGVYVIIVSRCLSFKSYLIDGLLFFSRNNIWYIALKHNNLYVEQEFHKVIFDL